MPEAAVIPAPIAYIKADVVRMLVVVHLSIPTGPLIGCV